MEKYSSKQTKVNKKLEKTVGEIKEFEWKHHNLIFLAASIVIASYILKFGYFHLLVSKLGNFGYVSSFMAGIFFAYGLTAVPAAAVLSVLSETLNPFLIALVAAFGTVISDYLIFRFMRGRLMDEIKLLSEEIEKLAEPISNLAFIKKERVILWKKISRSRIWKTLIPVIAGLIMASPLPDELGVAIFGAAKFEPKRFIIFCYGLHFIGILGIISLVKIL